MGILEKKIVVNASWNIGGKFLAQVITPLFAILIARILTPADFGLFAIVAAIIAFVDIIKDLGISQIIIIEQDDDDNLISMQFTTQLFLGAAAYAIIFVLAKFIANFFGSPSLEMAVNIYALMIFVYCLESPLETFYMKKNMYNILFYRQLLPALSYGLVTYLLAINGLGVFSLIIGHLFSRAMTACFLFVKSGWIPKFYFEPGVFTRLFKSGKHILTQSLLGFFVSQADSFIVGKFLGASNLGFYKTGNTLVNLLPNTVASQVQKVVFSDIARKKDDHRYYDMRYYQFFYIIGAMAVMLSIGTYYLSPLVINSVMGHSWIQMIPVAQVLSAVIPMAMIVTINVDYSKILGFNHIYTIYSVFRSILTLAVVYIGALFSLKLTVAYWVIATLLAGTANEICFFRSQKAVKYRYSKLVFFVFAWLWTAYVLLNNRISV